MKHREWRYQVGLPTLSKYFKYLYRHEYYAMNINYIVSIDTTIDKCIVSNFSVIFNLLNLLHGIVVLSLTKAVKYTVSYYCLFCLIFIYFLALNESL